MVIDFLKSWKIYQLYQFKIKFWLSILGCTNQNDSVDTNMKKLCGELAWYVQALEKQKTLANGTPKSVMAPWELIAA